MEQSLRERFLFWFCDTFGHNFKGRVEHYFRGKVINTCNRCGRMVSKPFECDGYPK